MNTNEVIICKKEVSQMLELQNLSAVSPLGAHPPNSPSFPPTPFCLILFSFSPLMCIQRFPPPKQLGNSGNQRNFLENVSIDIKMLIGTAFLLFYSFVFKINKIHFFISEKQEIILTSCHKAFHWVLFRKSCCFCFFLFGVFAGRLPELANPPERVSVAWALD